MNAMLQELQLEVICLNLQKLTDSETSGYFWAETGLIVNAKYLNRFNLRDSTTCDIW